MKARSRGPDKDWSSLDSTTVHPRPGCVLNSEAQILHPGTAKSSQLDSESVVLFSFLTLCF